MHFLSLNSLSREEFSSIINDAISGKKNPAHLGQPLTGKHIALIFEKPSTRTRVSFEVGIGQLGGKALVLNRGDIQLSRGESPSDTARVMSRYCDALMVRTFDHGMLEELAKHSSIPIINGLSDRFHPCQALADFMTIQENEFNLAETVFVYLGDANNNVCHSLVLASALAGCQFRVACPDGYEPDTNIIAQAEKQGLRYQRFDNVADACRGADVLYTDVWVSMGQESETEKRKKVFAPFQINKEALAVASDNAIVLHCLPAHKGLEITDEVFESKHSRIFDQAENRMHAQKALLAYLFS